MQSRGPRLNDVLSEREANEIAGSPRGLSLKGGPASQKSEHQSNDNKSGEEKFREEAEKATHAAPVPARSVEQLSNEVRGVDQKIAKLTEEGKVIFDKPSGMN